MRNAGLEEAQAGIKIAGRNTNDLTYADDTTLMAQSEEELKSLLMKVKEKSGEIAPEGMKRQSQSGNNAQLWLYPVVKVKSKAIKTILHRDLEC